MNYPHRFTIDVKSGFVLVGSDAHYWPGLISTAHKGFVKLIKELQPKLVVANGDMFDGASISRHPPIGWEKRPTVKQELDTTKERLGEIRDASPKAKHVWDLGNHDARFETRLAAVAAEYAGIDGIHLKDHFPDWRPAWSTWINDNVVVKHRFKGGVHAAYNNAVSSGKSIVTGHLHSGKVSPYTDYNGTRFGVDAGTLADPQGPQFVHYTEDNPKNWTASFTVLEFYKGKLLWPEIAYVFDPQHIAFRGRIIKV